jgi:hypothetical protein
MGDRRAAEARMKFFGHGRAADYGAPFEDERPQTLLREIECRNESVVARTNYHDLARFRHV